VLVRTRGYGPASSSGKPSWLLIKHKDEWAGPVAITEFAPLSVKTPDADFAEILSGRTPEIWKSHAPARGGDAAAMYKKIIERALTMTAPQKTNTKNTKTTTSKPKAKAAKKPKPKTARSR
jgi:hypothetical protein